MAMLDGAVVLIFVRIGLSGYLARRRNLHRRKASPRMLACRVAARERSSARISGSFACFNIAFWPTCGHTTQRLAAGLSGLKAKVSIWSMPVGCRRCCLSPCWRGRSGLSAPPDRIVDKPPRGCLFYLPWRAAAVGLAAVMHFATPLTIIAAMSFSTLWGTGAPNILLCWLARPNHG